MTCCLQLLFYCLKLQMVISEKVVREVLQWTVSCLLILLLISEKENHGSVKMYGFMPTNPFTCAFPNGQI